MKKLCTVILALALCLGLAAPVLGAAPPAAAGPVYGPVTILDGSTVITFTEARMDQSRTIMVSRQVWSLGSAAATITTPERTDISLIVVKAGSQITKSAGITPANIAFCTKAADGSYLVGADRLNLYSLAYSADSLFAYPFAKADLCLLSTMDGASYYIMSETNTLTEAPLVPTDYIVQPGDTLDKIAMNYYGAANLGTYLQKANPDHFAATGGILEAGRPLVLPVSLNGVPRLAAPLAGENELLYIVRSGDTLMGISQRYYGRSDFVQQIYQRNADRMKNINILSVGQVLVLPVIRTTA